MALLLTSASNVWLCLQLANEQRGCQSNCIIGLSITRQLEKNFNSIFFKSEVCSRDLDLNLRHCDKSGTGRMLNISWRWLVLMRQKYSDFQDNANLFQLSSGTDCPASRFKKALYNTSQWFVAIICVTRCWCFAKSNPSCLLANHCFATMIMMKWSSMHLSAGRMFIQGERQTGTGCRLIELPLPHQVIKLKPSDHHHHHHHHHRHHHHHHHHHCQTAGQ